MHKLFARFLMFSGVFLSRTVTQPRGDTQPVGMPWGARLLLMLLGLILLCPVPAAANPIGTVISLTPGVSVLRDGQTLPLALKDPVEAQDTIVTDATGKAQIIFSDDSTVTLANSTNLDMSEFNYEDGDPAFKGHVGQGLVRVITGKIVEQNPDGFSITTPHATVGIRGTVLDVGVDENRTTVFVENTLHKEVFVNNTQVPQGNKAIVDSAGASPILQPLTPQDQNDLDTDATVSTPIMTETAQGTPAAIPGPDSDLTSQNLPQQALADDVTGTPPPTPIPPAPPSVIIATVSGALSPDSAPHGVTAMTSPGPGPQPDYVGTFSFSINMSTGAISGATMQASSALTTVNGLAYNLTGGTGTMAAGAFHIANFGGNVIYPYVPIPTNIPQPVGDANTYLDGSGNINAVGGTVSGTYFVNGASTTGWAVDGGTFTGARTN